MRMEACSCCVADHRIDSCVGVFGNPTMEFIADWHRFVLLACMARFSAIQLIGCNMMQCDDNKHNVIQSCTLVTGN